MAKKILVIGAGISGLTAAYRLKERGFEVRVIDSAPRAGGVINTVSENGFRAESGSNSVMVQSAKTLDFIREIGLEGRMVTSNSLSKKRFFVKNGKICEVPMNPVKMAFSPLFSLAGKFRILADLWKKPHDPDSDPSVAEFTVHRMGREALDYGMNPFMAGIYGGNPEKLSARYAFPPFWKLEQKYGSIVRGGMKARREKAAAGNFFKPVMISFKDGLAELVDRLASLLDGSLSLGARIASVDYDMGGWRVCWTSDTGEDCDEFDEMVIAVPAKKIRELPLPGTLAAALAPLDRIEYAPVASVTMGFRRSDVAHPLDGFGALVPEKEKNYRILGALFVSTVFVGRAPSGCVTITCYVGGMRSPELAKLGDAELVELALDDLRRLVGLSGRPMFERVFRWENGIAQYNVGYGEFLEAAAEARAEFPTVRLLGSYLGGVGVSSCMENALAAAESVPQ